MAAKKAVGKKLVRVRVKPVLKKVEVPVEVVEKPLKPGQCRGYMRRKLAGEFPEIVSGFVEEAKKGSCAHVKLASELLEKTAVKRVSRKKGSAELMLEELKKL